MGKFFETSYKDTINDLTNIKNDLLNNPYYLFTDKKACPVTYYHINDKKSTLDEAAKIVYSDLGTNCPLRYNKIKDFFLFGIDKIALSLENGEAGLEASEISGEAIVLPDTITPYVGDYFEINHVKDSTWLFRVNDVQKDTMENGSNLYKLNYKLEHTSNENILPLIVENYTMITNNIGTQYTSILQSDKYDLGVVLESVSDELVKYYKELFYSNKVQTFIFNHYYLDKFYDDYMLEFLIRNKILETDVTSDYLYIDHKLPLPNTFSIDYAKTFFRSIETKDIVHLKTAMIDSTANYIDNFGSIFASMPDNYFSMNYKVYNYDFGQDIPYKVHDAMNCFPKELVTGIENKTFFTKDDTTIYPLYNIIVKYFNNIDYIESDFEDLESMDYEEKNIRLFYLIPICIFSIREFIKSLIS